MYYSDVCNLVNKNCLAKQKEKKAKRKKYFILFVGTGLFIAIMILMFAIFTTCKADAEQKSLPENQARVEKQIKQKYGKKVKFYDTGDIDEYIIVTRQDKKQVVVERVTGIVVDDEKNGEDENGHYISYQGLAGIHKGSKVVSYLVYNPNTYWLDDIIERFDVVVQK